MNTIYTQIGLFLDIVGIIILFFFGPPISTILPDGSELVWMGREDTQKAKEAQRKINLSRIGLIYIGLGFIFQLIGSLK